MSAPNPWFKDLAPLDCSGIFIDGENALDLIRYFLLEWPGEETVKLSAKNRHERFMQIIAGYPEIDVGRYPLDWPLHEKAGKALRLTRYLDSIGSPDKTTSLRSILLNKSIKMKSSNGKELESAHRRLLSILLLSLRSTSNNTPSHKFTIEEQKMLTALHSNEQSRVIDFWPWLELKKALNFTNLKAGLYLPTYSKNDLKKEFCTGWLENNDISNPKPNLIYHVKLKKIQSWITNWSDSFGKIPGIESTLVRGASAILESIMSSLRRIIIDRYGVESIIVDGGGRIVFSGDADSKTIIEDAFTNVFSISDGRRPYYNYELGIVATVISGKSTAELKREDYRLIFGINNDHEEHEKNQIIRDWIKKHLPKLAITIEAEFDDDSSEDFQKIIGSDECFICNENISYDGSNLKDWKGQIRDKEMPYCNFHRLLYEVGKSQRMIDSTTKNRGESSSFSDDRNRRIQSIARLDLNSLGILFTSRYEGDKSENSIDIRRRRSIRFNCLWWRCVNDVLDDKDRKFDRIVAWVAAGDDLILADYCPANLTQLNDMDDLLLQLSSNLSELSEFGKFKLSFGAGISDRLSANSIVHMMYDSKKGEESAKNVWKQIMSLNSSTKWMITKITGEIKEFESVDYGSGNCIIENDSVIYQYSD